MLFCLISRTISICSQRVNCSAVCIHTPLQYLGVAMCMKVQTLFFSSYYSISTHFRSSSFLALNHLLSSLYSRRKCYIVFRVMMFVWYRQSLLGCWICYMYVLKKKKQILLCCKVCVIKVWVNNWSFILINNFFTNNWFSEKCRYFFFLENR